MQWHSGYALSQTVFTLQYVHDLDVIVDFWPTVSSDPARPVELLILVLVACVEGVLKCCDMTWRELTKGRVFDVRMRFLLPSSHVHADTGLFADRGLAIREKRCLLDGGHTNQKGVVASGECMQLDLHKW